MDWNEMAVVPALSYWELPVVLICCSKKWSFVFAAVLFLPLHIPIPPTSAASILLWHREKDKFVGAAAFVKWRSQSGHKWVHGQKGGSSLWARLRRGQIIMKHLFRFQQLIIYIPQHIRDVHHKSWCQCAACSINLDR